MQESPDTKRYLFRTEAFYYYDLLKKQWGIILVFCLSAVSCSLLLTFVSAEKYRATTDIFYRPRESTNLRLKTTESFGAPVPSPPFKVINQTLFDLVKSEAILRPVVVELKLYQKDPPPREAPIRYAYWVGKDWIKERLSDCLSLLKYARIISEDPIDKAVRNLKKNISLETKRDSYVLTLSVKDTKPKRAAAIADLIGRNLVLLLQSQDASNIGQKLARMKQQLTSKEQRLSELRNRRAQILAANNLASLPEDTEKSVSNLYQMELDSARNNSLIQEKERKIAELEAETANSGTYLNPDDMKRLKSQKLTELVELKGIAARQAKTQEAIAALKTRLRRYPGVQKEIEQLDMLISTGANEYQQLSDLHLESAQNAVSMRSEIRVVHAATVPALPVQPIKIYHLCITAVLSLIVSVSLVCILAFFNLRLFFTSEGVQGRRSRNQTVPDNEDERRLSHAYESPQTN